MLTIQTVRRCLAAALVLAALALAALHALAPTPTPFSETTEEP